MMDLRHLQTFVTVAEVGTVTKAALRLHVAQPALSRQISELERQFGVRLFDRVGRRLILSSAGEQLLSDSRGLLNYAKAIGERAEMLGRGDAGILRVAASPQHIESVFSHFLHRYARKFPNVQVKVTEGTGLEILAMLERGEIQLAQNLLHAVQIDRERFEGLALGSVELLAACHASLDLGNRSTMDISQLAAYPLLLLDTGFGFRRAFDAASRLAGMQANILIESRSPHTLLALAEAKHGVAIIPSALRTDRYALRIVGLTYRGKPLREPLTILWDKRRPRTPFAVAFCEMLAQYVLELFPITKPSSPPPRRLPARTSKKPTSK